MYIDTHAHLVHCFGSPVLPDTSEYEKISYLIDISISPSEILNLSHFSSSPRVKQAFGYYPELCTLWNASEKARLEEWIQTISPIAIGEIGLDYHHNYGTPSKQQKLFIDQLELASRYSKPVLIHSRSAFDDTFHILKTYHPSQPIVLHCFGYGPKELELFLSLDNIFVSFAGNISYPSAHSLREAIRIVPLERLFLETDSPYLAPVPHRGKPNRPSYIEHTYHFVAQWLDIPLEELCQQIEKNFHRIFG